MRKDRLRPGMRAMVTSLIIAGACKDGPDAPGDKLSCVVGLGPIVTLMADTGANGVDPGFSVARDSHGNFFGDAAAGGQILKWAPDGRLVARFGKIGEGPGELAPGTFTVFVVNDSLYVRDNHMHWVVFDPELQFVRNASLGPVAGITAAHTVFFGPDRIFASFLQPNRAGGTLLIASRGGDVLRPFATAAQVKVGEEPPSRPATLVGADRFWVAPAPGPHEGYRIEVWDTAGRLVDSVIRNVEWFKPQADEATGPTQQDVYRRRFPTLGFLWTDDQGIVWTRVTVPKGPGSEDAMRNASSGNRDSVRAKVLETRIEAWDPSRKKVLASGVFPAGNATFAMPIPNSRMYHRVTSDTFGNRIVQVGALTLTGPDGAPCSLASR